MSQSAQHRPVAIVTDSTADIPPHLLEDKSITTVPLTVELSGEVYRDGVDLSRDEFLRRLQGEEWPRTSQPSVGAFQEVYQGLIDGGHDILSIHIATNLSGTTNSAHNAAQAIDPDRIHVVDSENASMALGWLVLEAYERAASGQSLSEVAGFAERRRADTRVVAMLETLEYLRRGGRIGRASALLGSALKVKPIIEIRAGSVEPRERIRTSRRAIDRLVAIAEELGPWDRMAVMHLGAPDGAATFAERLRSMNDGQPVVQGQLGTVIGAYGGPGVIGVAGLVKSGTSAP